MSRQEWLYYDFYIVFSRSKYEWCSGKLKINLTVCTFCSLWFWSLFSVQSMHKMRVECTQSFGGQNQTVSFPKHFLFFFKFCCCFFLYANKKYFFYSLLILTTLNRDQFCWCKCANVYNSLRELVCMESYLIM